MTRVVQTDNGDWVSLADLNVPPSQAGSKALAHTLARHDGLKTHTATVVDGKPDSSGAIRVRVDSTVTRARLTSTAKSVRTGDTVEVVKFGGHWEVTAGRTYHEPPAVSGSMGNKPPAASTVSGSVSKPTPGSATKVSEPPPPPSMPTGDSNAVLYSKMRDVVAHLDRLDDWARYQVRNNYNSAVDVINSTRTAGRNNADVLESLLSTTNTNASRLNQTRDYASNAGQLVEPVVGALRDEGIVK